MPLAQAGRTPYHRGSPVTPGRRDELTSAEGRDDHGSGSGGIEVSERRDDAFVDGTLERDDQIRETAHRFPTPLVELGLVAPPGGTADIDFAVVADEAECEPFLRLAPIAPFPRSPGHDRGKVVGIPFRSFGEECHRADVGLLVQFAQGGGIGVLAWVDSALRHLPRIPVAHVLPAGLGLASTDQNDAVPVQQHHADAGAIRQLVPNGRDAPGHRPASASALTGTSSMPLVSSALAQRAMRSTLIGRALAVPTAKPRSRAASSSRASSRSIASGRGTPSSTAWARKVGTCAVEPVLITERLEEPSSRTRRPRPDASRRIGARAASSEVSLAPIKVTRPV